MPDTKVRCDIILINELQTLRNLALSLGLHEMHRIAKEFLNKAERGHPPFKSEMETLKDMLPEVTAILRIDSTFSTFGRKKQTCFRNTFVRLLGDPIEGVQYFERRSGEIGYAQESYFGANATPSGAWKAWKSNSIAD